MGYSKFDSRVNARYLAYLLAIKDKDLKGSISDEYLVVTVMFKGSVSGLEKTGFVKSSVYGPVVYGDIRVEDLEQLVLLPDITRVEAEPKAYLLLEQSVPEINAPLLWNCTPSYKGSGVVVGIVDTGIDIFYNCFRKLDGGNTRIPFLWNHTLPATGGTPPAELGCGQEFTAKQINATLSTPNQLFVHQDVDGYGKLIVVIVIGDGPQGCACHRGDYFFISLIQGSIIIIAKSGVGHQSDVKK